EEYGNPDRAEFIRVQVGRARLSWDDPRRQEMKQRERELWVKNRRAWNCELPGWAGCEEFERGFAQEIYTDTPSFLRRGGELWQRSPVTRVRIYLLQGPLVGRLAASQHLARVQSLEVYNSRLGPEGARVLASSPGLAHLRGLSLSG